MLPTYRVEGPAYAPAVVLGNSLGATSAMWDAQVPALVGRFRVVRYEQRGHGGTAAPPGPYSMADLGGDVIELLDHLGIEQAALCGVSLGGMVALWVASHHPERVSGLVLSGVAAQLPPAEAWAERAAAVRASGPASLAETLLGRWFTPTFLDGHPEVGSAVRRWLAAADPEGYAGCCEAIGGMDQRGDLAAVTAPTLVVTGAMDPVAPPAVALGLQEGISGSALLVLAHAAHLANIEQPDRFTEAVVDHLAGPPAERGRRARQEVLGEDFVARSEAVGLAEPFMAPLVDIVTRYGWGEPWTRSGLDRKTRSCITMAMLTALRSWEELAVHVRGARRNGLTEDQIGEVLVQTAIYCGVPAANRGFAVARRVFKELHDTPDGG